MKKIAVLLSLLFIFSSAVLAEDAVQIKDPYLRATAPGQVNAAAYLTLVNHSDFDQLLKAVVGDIAQRIEIHQHVHKNGRMSMQQVMQVKIPAGGVVSFKPGGYHVMLFDIKQALKENQEYQLTLQFANGQQISEIFNVQALF